MYEAKTKPTSISVVSYLAAIPDESRRKDCQEIAALMERITGCQPQMWGTSIVGFDQYHYKYASGHEGDAAVVGFSSRKAISLFTWMVSKAPKPSPCYLNSASTRPARSACISNTSTMWIGMSSRS